MVSEFEEYFEGREVGPIYGNSIMWTKSDRTMAILVHMDNMVVKGTDDTVKELIQCLYGQYKITGEEGN